MSTPDFTERKVAPKSVNETDSAAADAEPEPGQKGREAAKPVEIGGPTGPDPTRYGDWELNGRCIDF